MAEDTSRTVRLFLSSTFRDFGEERDLLVRQVFPALRAKLRDRFVELVDVDLRWGITVEQAERGEVLPICLAEIDRARPYFIGMIGERYGWVPPPGAVDAGLIERQPWMAEHAGGKSVTELEILHGALNNPALAGRVFFYLRSPGYARAKAGDYLPTSREDRARQVALKCRVRRSGFPVARYGTPEELASRIERDLWVLLDAEFPAQEVPDPAERESRRHEAYAAPRRRLYLGAQANLAALDEALASGEARILVEGASGGGKSALLANWAQRHRRAHPGDRVFEHYLAASTDAADPQALLRRLLGMIQRVTGSQDTIPEATEALFDSVGAWLSQASVWAEAQGVRWLILMDALNGLRSRRDLRWWPSHLPSRVHVVVSCLPGKVLQALQRKGSWHRVQVPPLQLQDRRDLLVRYLATFKKTLDEASLEQVLAHPLSGNPLFLRTLAEELRLFGVHEVLTQRLRTYLECQTVEDLFGQVLARLEEDFGLHAVPAVLRAVWASRAGLREEELLDGQRPGLAGLVHATWAPLRHAMDDLLIEGMGRIGFAHDYLRQAVSRRYLAGEGHTAAAHQSLARWFAEEPNPARRAFEQPYQLREAGDWDGLMACLTDRTTFQMVQQHRGSQELLGCWLAIRKATGTTAGDAYRTAWPAWRQAEPAGFLEAAERLQVFLAFIGEASGFAVDVAEQTLELSRQQLGPDHPRTLDRMNRMAILFKNRGELARAESLYLQVLQLAPSVHGESSSPVGQVTLNLAELYRTQSRFGEAEDHARRALALQERARGPESMAVWTALNTLATVLRQQRQLKEAIELQTRALRIVTRRRGHEHPDTAMSLNNVGLLFSAAGKKAEAERALRKALGMREKLLGPDHPMTSTSRNNLAMFLKSAGQRDEARALFESALQGLEQQYGRRHPRVATCLANLGGLLVDTGDWPQAQAVLEESLALRESLLDPGHAEIATSLNHLARLHEARGEPALAVSLRERALSLQEKTLGALHPDTRTTLSKVARLHESMGELEQAEACLQRLLDLRLQALGEQHESVTKTRERRERLSDVRARLGRP